MLPTSPIISLPLPLSCRDFFRTSCSCSLAGPSNYTKKNKKNLKNLNYCFCFKPFALFPKYFSVIIAGAAIFYDS
jgi:hypothetical protein